MSEKLYNVPASIRQHIGKDQRRDNRGVGLDHELGRVDGDLFPGDLLVGHGAGVGTIAGGRVADLAEVAPERRLLAFQILAQHGHDADREVAGNAAADLEEADRLLLASVRCTSRPDSSCTRCRCARCGHS